MPDWKDDLRARLAGLRLSPAREAEIIEELSQHLDDRYQELCSAGEAPSLAREVALAELRDHDLLSRGMRTLRQAHVPEPLTPGSPAHRLGLDLLKDVRYALRMLRRQPGFTTAVVLTLALGIGANTAIFSLVNAALIEKLPARDPERLVYIFNSRLGGGFSYPDFSDLREDNGVVAPMAAWGGIGVSLNTGGEVDLVGGAIVTGAYFDVLGVNAALGRAITPADDVTPGGHPVVVLSHAFWSKRFGRQPDVVGQKILLNGVPFEVVGVMPRGFTGAERGVERDLFVPMMMQAVVRPPRGGFAGEMDPDLLSMRGNSWLTGVGRLATGVTPEQAAAALSTRATALDRARVADAPEHPIQIGAVTDGMPGLRDQMVPAAGLLLAIVGAVLLIACANVANLLLSRAASRRREVWVRLALGASRRRLVRQLLTESVLLAVVGAGVGLVLAWMLGEAWRASPAPAGALPIALDFTLDATVLGFSLALAVATGLVFGLAPALAATRPGLVPALKDDAILPEEGMRRVSLKKALVVAEVALSLTLLVAAGLFVRSLIAAQRVDTGVDASRIVNVPLNVSLLRYTTTQGRLFYQHAVERVEAIPGVESAAVARVALLAGGGRTTSFEIEGREPIDAGRPSGSAGVDTEPLIVGSNVVSAGYSRTLGVSLLGGRDFDGTDTPDSPAVVVINEAFRALHFPDGGAVGQRIRLGSPRSPWRTIVGVVETTKYYTVLEGDRPMTFVPLSQNHETGVTLHVRAAGDPSAVVPEIRRTIQALEPNLPMPNIQTMSEAIATSLYASRAGTWLVASMGLLALVLAAVGVYGVMAFSVARRTREMGIRVALGAERRDIVSLVLREGMALVLSGVGIGLVAAFVIARLLSSYLFGVRAADVPAFVIAPVVLCAVALVASLIPTWRALKVNPTEALRQA